MSMIEHYKFWEERPVLYVTACGHGLEFDLNISLEVVVIHVPNYGEEMRT